MNGYTLYAECLASKWGFGDGDGLQDYLYDLHRDGLLVQMPDRDKFLHAVVIKYLAPELARRGVHAEIYCICSNHNPVRAEKINGIEVNHYDPEACPEVLKGIVVVVPREEIIAIAKDFKARS